MDEDETDAVWLSSNPFEQDDIYKTEWFVNINEYPFMESILWDKTGISIISETDLFYYVEKRWNYIDHDNLIDEEQDFIQYLIDEYGGGIRL